jgi:pimeloyl-ACP methyl ester carboxylesterase
MTDRWRTYTSLIATLGAALLALVQPATVTAGPDRTQLVPCTLPDLKAARARCGTIYARENPAREDSRKIPIHFAVVPARSSPLDHPIVPLMGGPGEDAISAAAIFAQQFDALREHHDLLLIDQRGSGQSAPLHCDLYSKAHPETSLSDVFPAAAVKSCEATLGANADLTQYGYARFADDIERIRVILGYKTLDIFAGSYGTRAAVVFLRAHPTSARTAFLGSVVPIDIAQPLPMAQTAQKAFDELFTACAADTSCHGAFPQLRAEFEEIEARLSAGVEVTLPDSSSKARLSYGRVIEWMRSLLYRPKSAMAIPWYIHQAFAGNWDPIVSGILTQSQQVDEDLSLGLFFAITCNEDVPFLDGKAIVEQTRATYLGDYRVRQQQAACESWPRSPLPAGYRHPVRSSVPTLFVTGDTDGGTPVWFTEHVAPGFSASVKVIAHGQGHTEWSECVGRLYQRLVESGSTQELAGATCPPTARPAFKTTP